MFVTKKHIAVYLFGVAIVAFVTGLLLEYTGDLRRLSSALVEPTATATSTATATATTQPTATATHTPAPTATAVPIPTSTPVPQVAVIASEPKCFVQDMNRYGLGKRATYDAQHDNRWFTDGGTAIWLTKGSSWRLSVVVYGYDRSLEYYVVDANGSELLRRRMTGADAAQLVAPYDGYYWLGLWNPSYLGNKTVEVSAVHCL